MQKGKKKEKKRLHQNTSSLFNTYKHILHNIYLPKKSSLSGSSSKSSISSSCPGCSYTKAWKYSKLALSMVKLTSFFKWHSNSKTLNYSPFVYWNISIRKCFKKICNLMSRASIRAFQMWFANVGFKRLDWFSELLMLSLDKRSIYISGGFLFCYRTLGF